MGLLETTFQTLSCYGKYGLANLIPRRAARPSPASEQRHLVILAWYFAPHINGGVYRPAALARHALDSGYRVTVFAGPAPDNPTEAGMDLLTLVGEGVNIVRVTRKGPYPSEYWFPRLDGGLHNGLDLYTSARAHLRKSPPDIIVASGPPFHVFVTGYWLARCFGAKLVLDYRDEWSLCPFDFVFKNGFGRGWEMRCLRNADRVLFTTNAQLQALSDRTGPWLKGKSRLAPNGWEPSQPASTAVQRIACGRITLLFAGSLLEHTKVQPFLDALAVILKQEPEWRKAIVVRFLGMISPAETKRLERFAYPEVIEMAGLVPLAQALRQMREADALLLFHDDRMARYLPGKLYEYLASGRPIILCNDDGESKRVVEALDAGWAIDCADTEQLRQILTSLMHRREPATNNAVRQDWLRRHTRQALTKELLADLSTLF